MVFPHNEITWMYLMLENKWKQNWYNAKYQWKNSRLQNEGLSSIISILMENRYWKISKTNILIIKLNCSKTLHINPFIYAIYCIFQIQFNMKTGFKISQNLKIKFLLISTIIFCEIYDKKIISGTERVVTTPLTLFYKW